MLAIKPPNGLQLLTLEQAAMRLGCSYSWAAQCAHSGRLEAYRPDPRGRIYVAERSLATKGKANRLRTATGAQQRPSYLRLVVDNTGEKVSAPPGRIAFSATADRYR